ncbi:hypothetical protein [Vibrio scophthalmi]|uniref:Uncharacterized protein n=1 Tax=Vibrio scophthalmi TaxID=45658 RepID=A0A1C7FEM7_9VIBR|nr:hypothetical protein [Vibrio scophthalmi]ANU38366.1 hypothetical protein VSVS05_03328 [Vibrio scophthalmi]
MINRTIIKFVFLVFPTLTIAEPLIIVPITEKLLFPEFYISGTNQKAIAHPKFNQTDSFSFFVEGVKGRQFKISLAPNQSLNDGKSAVSISKFIFGCGLSSSGKGVVKQSGRSELLCIGAQALRNPLMILIKIINLR